MTSITNTTLPDSTVEQEKSLFTTEALVDELFLCLAGSHEIVINSENYKLITVNKYYHQAHELFYRIPVWKPSPPFVIYISDLTPKVKTELDEVALTNPNSLDYILKQAVGRIFENLNFEYYHLSIARSLKVILKK